MKSKVLIIGGGVIGLAIARELHKKGVRDISVVDSGRIGGEASFAAAGLLAPQAEADSADDFFDLCRESNLLFPQFAEELIDETGVDIELDRNGTFYLAFDEKDSTEIARRFAWQAATGLNVEKITAGQILRDEPIVSADVREGLYFPGDWQVENRKLLKALRKYADLNGVGIIENTRVTGLTVDGGIVTNVRVDKGRLYADSFVLATGAWTSLIKTDDDFLGRLGIKPIRGQMISFQSSPGLFRRVIYSPRGYVVPRHSGKILAGATVEDVGFDHSITEEGIANVRRNALEIAPGLAKLEPTGSWAGLRPYAADGLPVLGEFTEAANLIIAAAHYRNGILLSPLTAKIVADKIAENVKSKYLEIFGVSRFDQSRKSAVGISTGI